MVTFAIRMSSRFYQFLYSSLFALLTVLGMYDGQLQQYISQDTSFDLQYSSGLSQNEHPVFYIGKEDRKFCLYTADHPHYINICADFSEIDSENDDNVETSPELLTLFKEDFRHLISNFVTKFHDKKVAVSLAHSELLHPSQDDLYIQYRVIRL